MVIGLDHGYYACKGPNVYLKSGIVAYDYEPYTQQNVLQYGGRYYVCGTGRQTLVKDKTANDNYYLLTMAAIAQEIKFRKAERKNRVVLAAGLPLTSFGREKLSFKEYLLRKGQPLRYYYEGELFEILIEDVKLFPQAYSAIAMQPELIAAEPSVLLADVGGWTVDTMLLSGMVPEAATCRSLELGVIRCIDEIMEQVRRNTGLSVTDAQIESVLQGNSCTLDSKVKALILQHGRSYTEKILSSIMEAGFDLKAIPSIFMGGGASILKQHVRPQDSLCRMTAITDVHANASGYERIVGQMSRP